MKNRLSDETPKTGSRMKGVTGVKPKLVHVDLAVCPESGALHDLTNRVERDSLVTSCSTCKKTWPELDAELNKRGSA